MPRSVNSSLFHLVRGAKFAGALPLLVGMFLFLSEPPALPDPSTQDPQTPIPLLAYYYIWFDHGSWDRAKTDFPLLGRYSSDDHEVMLQHVQWAKQVGFDGFIVSWKSTEQLNPRLEQLMGIAAEEDFKLVIIYQGLNFERLPLPAERISADLDTFITQYASHESFSLFSRPLVIWSGTWKFSREEIARVTDPRRDRLLILASEKNVDGFQRLADLVDGNAYYWASVNPDTFPGYQEKLYDLGEAIHAHGGLWIAPAAPGFDARLVGGTTVVERKDGVTLRRELDTAMRSSPDAVGLISWNEFSENTQVEPSLKYGRRYLEILADIQGGSVPEVPDFDSSEPAGIETPIAPTRIISIGAMIILILVSVITIVRRNLSKSSPTLGE